MIVLNENQAKAILVLLASISDKLSEIIEKLENNK